MEGEKITARITPEVKKSQSSMPNLWDGRGRDGVDKIDEKDSRGKILERVVKDKKDGKILATIKIGRDVQGRVLNKSYDGLVQEFSKEGRENWRRGKNYTEYKYDENGLKEISEKNDNGGNIIKKYKTYDDNKNYLCEEFRQHPNPHDKREMINSKAIYEKTESGWICKEDLGFGSVKSREIGRPQVVGKNGYDDYELGI